MKKLYVFGISLNFVHYLLSTEDYIDKFSVNVLLLLKKMKLVFSSMFSPHYSKANNI